MMSHRAKFLSALPIFCLAVSVQAQQTNMFNYQGVVGSAASPGIYYSLTNPISVVYIPALGQSVQENGTTTGANATNTWLIVGQQFSLDGTNFITLPANTFSPPGTNSNFTVWTPSATSTILYTRDILTVTNNSTVGVNTH